VATTAVDDLAYERDKRRIAALDDVALVYVMLGLQGEAEGMPGWGRTDEARVMSRIVFGEIARRWIPLDVFGEAFRQLEVGGDDV
jgi:hypothetical protein